MAKQPKCTCAEPCKQHGTLAYTYEAARRVLATALEDLRILAGDEVGPSDVTWQDVAGTAAVNLRVLARMLEAARQGFIIPIGSAATFPSPDDCSSDEQRDPNYTDMCEECDAHLPGDAHAESCSLNPANEVK